MNKRIWLTASLSVVLATGLLTGCGNNASQNKESEPKQQTGEKQDNQSANQTSSKTYSKAPDMKIDKSKEYTATIKTNKGDIKIRLFDDAAPITVNNFVFLARDHFYDGIVFHRVIKNFMIQTGDPLGTGRGGPGYKFKDELPPSKEYKPGIVAMANAGPNTNGSQFFIGSGDDVNSLNRMPNYTVFGEVVDEASMTTVKAIASVPVELSAAGNEKSKPTEDVHINTVEIQEK